MYGAYHFLERRCVTAQNIVHKENSFCGCAVTRCITLSQLSMSGFSVHSQGPDVLLHELAAAMRKVQLRTRVKVNSFHRLQDMRIVSM